MLITNLSFVSFLQSSLVYGFLFRHKPVYNKYFKQFIQHQNIYLEPGSANNDPRAKCDPQSQNLRFEVPFSQKYNFQSNKFYRLII